MVMDGTGLINYVELYIRAVGVNSHKHQISIVCGTKYLIKICL